MSGIGFLLLVTLVLDTAIAAGAAAAAGVEADIQNAQGDVEKFGQLCDQMIGEGVKVLMIVNLDSGTGKAVLDKAKKSGIATIDYDRLTLSGGANFYVSFDNVKVGELRRVAPSRHLRPRDEHRPQPLSDVLAEADALDDLADGGGAV